MITTVVAYGLIAWFLVMEYRLRQGQAAKSLEPGQFDQGSTRWVGIAVGTTFLALLIAPVVNNIPLGYLALPWLGWLGIVMMLLGLGVRYWASKTLGAFYTRTLRIASTQHVVDSGPYRFIRNPGYLGDLFLFLGAGVAVLNWLAIVVIGLVLLTAYRYRIHAEELMLQATLADEYKAYMRRSWRLIPLIY